MIHVSADIQAVPSPSKSRKRIVSNLQNESSYDDFRSANMFSESGPDDDGFTKVVSRHARRPARKAASPNSSSTIRSSTPTTPSTVVFAPKDPTYSLGTMNKIKLSRFLEALAPSLVKEARVNPRKNVIAVDANDFNTVDNHLATTSLCRVDVRAYLPRAKNTVIGVIRNVDVDTPEWEISQLV